MTTATPTGTAFTTAPASTPTHDLHERTARSVSPNTPLPRPQGGPLVPHYRQAPTISGGEAAPLVRGRTSRRIRRNPTGLVGRVLPLATYRRWVNAIASRLADPMPAFPTLVQSVPHCWQAPTISGGEAAPLVRGRTPRRILRNPTGLAGGMLPLAGNQRWMNAIASQLADPMPTSPTLVQAVPHYRLTPTASGGQAAACGQPAGLWTTEGTAAGVSR